MKINLNYLHGKYPPLDIVAPVIFVLVFFTMLMYSRLEPHVEEVNMKYVIMNRYKPGFVLVDVRSEAIYDGRAPYIGMKMPPQEGVPGGHIPGAVSFPAKDLNVAAAAAALAKVGITRENNIILYCNTGVLSGRFGDALIRKFNFSPSKIKHYTGGIVNWTKDEENVLLPEDHDPPYYSEDYWVSYMDKY